VRSAGDQVFAAGPLAGAAAMGWRDTSGRYRCDISRHDGIGGSIRTGLPEMQSADRENSNAKSDGSQALVRMIFSVLLPQRHFGQDSFVDAKAPDSIVENTIQPGNRHFIQRSPARQANLQGVSIEVASPSQKCNKGCWIESDETPALNTIAALGYFPCSHEDGGAAAHRVRALPAHPMSGIRSVMLIGIHIRRRREVGRLESRLISHHTMSAA